jgi:hypothetical protein
MPKQPMPAWFACTTNDPLVALTASLFHETQSWRLSLRRHGCAVGRSSQASRATKSALVEAALDRFLGSDDDIDDTATVAHHLAGLSRQLEELERNLRIANETAALHARFHLAVTPLMPAGEQGAACALGAERFEEFATQVGRRVDLGVPSSGRQSTGLAQRGRPLLPLPRESHQALDQRFTNRVFTHQAGLTRRYAYCCRPERHSNFGLAGCRSSAFRRCRYPPWKRGR